MPWSSFRNFLSVGKGSRWVEMDDLSCQGKGEMRLYVGFQYKGKGLSSSSVHRPVTCAESDITQSHQLVGCSWTRLLGKETQASSSSTDKAKHDIHLASGV